MFVWSDYFYKLGSLLLVITWLMAWHSCLQSFSGVLSMDCQDLRVFLGLSGYWPGTRGGRTSGLLRASSETTSADIVLKIFDLEKVQKYFCLYLGNRETLLGLLRLTLLVDLVMLPPENCLKYHSVSLGQKYFIITWSNLIQVWTILLRH